MLTMQLTTADLASIRFAISPAWELVAALRTLRDPGRHVVHLPWIRTHRDQLLSDPGLRVVVDLVVTPARHLPGFLAPTPSSPVIDLSAELETIAATPGEVVRAELTAVYPGGVPESLRAMTRAPRRGLSSLVTALDRVWSTALQPHWARMRGLLEADIVHRARQLADSGPTTMFGRLDPAITWADGLLAIDRPNLDIHHELDGRGLVLVPSLFSWPDVFVKAVGPWSPVLRYPARRVGALWETTRDVPDLAAALGATRATLLAHLADPTTTTELARLTGLSPGGVSTQLARLTVAGLAQGQRAGRRVLYTRTDRGEALFR